MVNTTALTLQQCADLAGTRTTPYPEQVAPPTVHACRACGNDLHGDLTPLGLPKVYCGKVCMRAHRASLYRAPDQHPPLSMTEYYWSEW